MGHGEARWATHIRLCAYRLVSLARPPLFWETRRAATEIIWRRAEHAEWYCSAKGDLAAAAAYGFSLSSRISVRPRDGRTTWYSFSTQDARWAHTSKKKRSLFYTMYSQTAAFVLEFGFICICLRNSAKSGRGTQQITEDKFGWFSCRSAHLELKIWIQELSKLGGN